MSDWYRRLYERYLVPVPEIIHVPTTGEWAELVLEMEHWLYRMKCGWHPSRGWIHEPSGGQGKAKT